VKKQKVARFHMEKFFSCTGKYYEMLLFCYSYCCVAFATWFQIKQISLFFWLPQMNDPKQKGGTTQQIS